MSATTSRRGARAAIVALAVLTGSTVAVGLAALGSLSERSGALRHPIKHAPVASATAERAERAEQLLDARAEAVLSRDRRAFLAPIDPAALSFQQAQTRLFDNLTRLPLAEWTYQLAGEAGPAVPANGATSTWTARVVLGYRLRDFDRGLVTRNQYLTFSHRSGLGWVISGDGQARGLRDDPEIWHQPNMRVVPGGSSLVLGVGHAQLLRDIAVRAERGVRSVRRLWGTGWSRRAVVLVPSSQRGAAALAGTDSGLGQIAALSTVMAGPQGVPDPGSGDRVIVAPRNFAELNPIGRQVVLTHELAHVATRAATITDMPMWLVEGFADYVAYRDTKLPVPVIAQELAHDVRAGRLPVRLPPREAFDPLAHRLAQAYEEAWLACRLVAQRWGERALVQLYHAASQARGSPMEIENDALVTVLGIGPEEFTARWRDYLREQL